MPDLIVTSLTVVFGDAETAVRPLDAFDLTIPAGSVALLVGPSGCGKTTLLSCLAGILTPTSGSIAFGSTEVSALRGQDLAAYRRREVGVVFQAFNLVPSLSALENVMAPLLAAGVRTTPARARARALLEQVDMVERADRRPTQLSGGQQQRVAIARALVSEPLLLLADEPTAHLDQVQVEAVMGLLKSLATPERVMVVATHDPRVMELSSLVVDLLDPGAAQNAQAGGGA